jgi:deoxyribodipyrimidine photo-lyase
LTTLTLFLLLQLATLQNWAAAAGITGGRVNRFNIVKQSKDYDQNGDYVRHWLPELKDVPTRFVHEPWKMTQFQQMEYGCKLGVDYPNPIIPPFQPRNDGGSGGPGHDGGKNGGRGGKQRKQYDGKANAHQKYEMKSLKEGRIDLK